MLTVKEILKRDLKSLKKSNPNLKGFNDLVFEEHPLAISFKTVGRSGFGSRYEDAKQARITLGDDEVSVLIGESFYSNGIDTYEYMSNEQTDPAGYIEKEEVEFLMLCSQLKYPRRLIIEKDNICKFQQFWEGDF